ncbi:S16 family serine protease [Ferrimonas sediminicola]|uniref:S16 family serine protease n=1 Tax=Ferrimonas sediminicola TaxID=2569538 RepID=UPI00145CE76A|nr:S16 family serine protease [Ferrimonas sediminicola]
MVNRQHYRLSAAQLTLQFGDDAGFHPQPQPPLLLGQPRVMECWQALSQREDRHLYLATLPGLDPLALIDQLNRGDGRPTRLVDRVISRAALYGNRDTPGLLSFNGLLLMPVEFLLERPAAWWPLRQALTRGYFQDDQGQQRRVECQLVLIGSSGEYDNLCGFDGDFGDVVELYGECQPELDIGVRGALPLWLSAVATLCAELCGRPLSLEAAQRLARHASRLVEHQQKLSLSWAEMTRLLKRLDSAGLDEVTVDEIERALNAQTRMHNALEESAHESIQEEMVLVQTQGEAVGQINGLTVVDYCGHSYGEPARITTTVHYGDGEVADIERKSELGGNIHAKGMMILSACLYRLFGRDAPLHLNANIVFEQSYQTIDGDSASLAEYCSLISAITDSPIAQNLALTGAVDQFGNVQAIGGINQKVEGFFRVCHSRGLTGNQGVILPTANARQLNLSGEVIRAVAENRFHLYQVDKVEQALELVCDIPLAEADNEGRYPENSLYGKVQLRLEQLVGSEDEHQTLWQRIRNRFGFS